VHSRCGKKKEKVELSSYISHLQDQGVGEIILCNIDRDGAMKGYDLNLISKVSNLFSVPFVILGGAGCVKDFDDALHAGASSVAAGSMFVFHGKHRAVLISYTPPTDLDTNFIN
jgi:cyclase